MTALSLRDVHVRYGSTHALRGVSLEVRRGEIVGLLGPNGSGKSTLLSVAAGLLEPAAGQVVVCGREQRFARQIGYVPQETSLYDELTAAQNLAFFGSLYGLRGDFVARGLRQARLTDRAHERVERFSGGMKQRLSIACALAHQPALLLLDEPTASLDAASRDALFEELHRLRSAGCAILLTSHHEVDAEQGCDHVVTLEAGMSVSHSRMCQRRIWQSNRRLRVRL